MFGDAAGRLGAHLVFATDRCDQLDDPWWDAAIPIRFYQEADSVEAILRAVAHQPPDGVVAVGDRATVIAAEVAERLDRPWHPPYAAAAARDKRVTRELMRAARLNVPWFKAVSVSANPSEHAPSLPYPVVVKPITLSGSRGVMRADSAAEYINAFERLRRLLQMPDVLAMRDAAANTVQVESFIEGLEYAVEGVLHHGELHTLAIFDKPDPLDGPFFEETIYITPSRASEEIQRSIRTAVAAACCALGLSHGPIHAECRVNSRGVFVLEVAARPIGGLCARALSFVGPAGWDMSLEELILRHALGDSPRHWRRERRASGVMMIPIPRAGNYRRTDGVDAARAVAGITAVEITAKPDQQLVPLPEGGSYLGFLFAKAESPAQVEEALRDAHARLRFVIDRAVPVTS
jgi:biotin carboxylase